MGWKHYWERGPELPREQFALAAADCQRVVVASGIALGGERGVGAPVFTGKVIAFDGTGGGCEPFVVRRLDTPRRGRPTVFSYCKTEKLPYDLCVQAALIVLKHHLGDAITVSSDGADEDWVPARNLCQDRLGYGADFTLAKV